MSKQQSEQPVTDPPVRWDDSLSKRFDAIETRLAALEKPVEAKKVDTQPQDHLVYLTNLVNQLAHRGCEHVFVSGACQKCGAKE